MNKVFVTGNLTNNPDLRYSRDNVAFARFGIAVKRTGKQDEVDFFNIVTFGKTAEFCDKYFQKGSRAFIEGKLQTSKYTDKDGNKRTSTEIIIDNIEFGDSKKKDSSSNYTPPEDVAEEEYDEGVDVPF